MVLRGVPRQPGERNFNCTCPPGYDNPFWASLVPSLTLEVPATGLVMLCPERCRREMLKHVKLGRRRKRNGNVVNGGQTQDILSLTCTAENSGVCRSQESKLA